MWCIYRIIHNIPVYLSICLHHYKLEWLCSSVLRISHVFRNLSLSDLVFLVVVACFVVERVLLLQRNRNTSTKSIIVCWSMLLCVISFAINDATLGQFSSKVVQLWFTQRATNIFIYLLAPSRLGYLGEMLLGWQCTSLDSSLSPLGIGLAVPTNFDCCNSHHHLSIHCTVNRLYVEWLDYQFQGLKWIDLLSYTRLIF